MPLLSGPMHIAFLEMVFNHVCTLMFEAETEEDDITSRTPAGRRSRCFPAPQWSGVRCRAR